MTETPPEVGVAEALHELSDQSRLLVRREITAAVDEILDKAKQNVPAAALAVAAGGLGLFAVASAYRLTLRVLEKALTPAGGAFVATALYGGGAAVAAKRAWEKFRDAPLPVPADTAREAGETLADAAGLARDDTTAEGPGTAA